MPTWERIKADADQLKLLLDNQTSDVVIENTVSGMNRFLANYINRAGIGEQTTSAPVIPGRDRPQPRPIIPGRNISRPTPRISPPGSGGGDSDYDKALNMFKNLQVLQKEYIKLNNQILSSITNLTNNSDIRAKLQQIGDMKQDIAKLQKEVDNSKQDVMISHSRQESVEKTKEHISPYQGFAAILGFSKPLHRRSIPFLIGFGTLLFFFSALLLKEYIGVSLKSGPALPSTAGGLFTDSRFHAALGGVVFTIVVVTILSATGRLGKVI